MTLAQTAADYAPNWPLLGLIALALFAGTLYLLCARGARNTPGTRAHLERRIVLAEQDEVVAAHRRRIQGTLD